MSGFLQMQAADYEFMKWVTEYGKTYGTRAEFDFRAEQFKSSCTKKGSQELFKIYGAASIDPGGSQIFVRPRM